MEFNYEFDVPMYYFDLSTQCRNSNLFLTIPTNLEEGSHKKEHENLQEIDSWFLVPHEAPPKTGADDLFFAELEKRDELMQRKSKGSLENSTTAHGKISSTQSRKRSLSDRSSTPTRRDPYSHSHNHSHNNGLASKPMRNKSILNAPPISVSSSTANPLKRCLSPPHTSKITNNENHNINLLQPEKESDSHCMAEKRRKTSMSSGPSRLVNPSSSTSNNLQTASSSSSSNILTRSKTSSQSTRANTTTSSSNTTTAAKTRTTQSSQSQAQRPVTGVKSKSSNTTKASATKSTSNTTIEDKSLEEMLKEHNAKFAPIPAYEPPMHSFRDVRKWEKKNGRLWSELKPEEREKVNQEITILKNANLL